MNNNPSTTPPQSMVDRIAGRKEAECFMELVGELDLGNRSAEFVQSFWSEVERIANEHLPAKQVTTEPQKRPSMTDEESERYEMRPIQFGVHKGTPIGDVPTEYLVWVHESSEPLGSYLRSKRGQRRQS